jgi:hypothetical protein
VSCCSLAAKHCRSRYRWISWSFVFCVAVSWRGESYDPCTAASTSSGAVYVRSACCSTTNPTMTTARSRAASKTRHCVSYCGRFSGISRIRPWLCGSRHAFFVVCVRELSMDKVFIGKFTTEFHLCVELW